MDYYWLFGIKELNKLEILERMKMKIKYYLLYVMVYNFVKLSEL